MFFGNDRMELIEAAVRRAQGMPWRYHDTSGVARSLPAPAPRPETTEGQSRRVV